MPAVPFLLVFIGGLVVAVYSMLEGVTPASAAGATTRISVRTAPSVAAFAVTFGAIGYLCTTRTSLNAWIVLLIALGAGAMTIAISAPLLAKLGSRRSEESSPETEIEGQLARVVQSVSDSTPGEIEYERDGRGVRRPALNIIKGAIQAGRDVVIDRIEAGIAFVEDWESVERRL